MSRHATAYSNQSAAVMEVTESVGDEKRTREHDFAHVFTAVLFALFVVLLLIGILVGTNVYRSLYASGERADAVRLSTSFLANQVRANDQIDSVACAWVTEEGSHLLIADENGLSCDEHKDEYSADSILQGSALVLRETLESGVYETRIYLYNGKIMQEYALAESPYNPDGATTVADSTSFTFSYADGLLTICTDAGETDIALRTAGGEAL